MSDITSMDRVGVLPLSNNTTLGNIISDTYSIVNADISTDSIVSNNNTSLIGSSQQKYLIYTDDVTPINKLINELTELKSAVADIKTRMTCIPIDNLINLSDDVSNKPVMTLTPHISTDVESNILKRSKVASSAPSDQLSLPASLSPPRVPQRLTILPEQVVRTNNPTLRPRETLLQIILGVALFGLLGAAVLSLSIIDNVLAEYCVISLYALNKFYVMYISNNTVKYTKCVFMIMAISLLIESTFLITSMFRILDKPSNVYSSIAALIDIGISWALARV